MSAKSSVYNMQATLDLNRKAKSKSQNSLIKQRKNRRTETTTEVAMASDECFSEGEIGEGFEWVWVFCLICWGCFQVWFLLIFGLIFVEFGFFVGWVWILLILALIFYWICGWIFMCCKMVVVGCISWVVVGRWLIGSANEERAREMKKKKKREEEGI